MDHSIAYTGTSDQVCPITLKSLKDIDLPVAFRSMPHQPYECLALLEWLNEKETNPMTNQEVYWKSNLLDVVAPLHICKDPKLVEKYIKYHTSQNYSLWVYFIFAIPYVVGEWSQVAVMFLALIHSVFTIKSLEATVVFMSGIYVLLVLYITVVVLDSLYLPINLVLSVVFYVKSISQIVDVYSNQIRRALNSSN